MMPAIGAVLRVAGSAGRGARSRTEEVQRGLTVADVLPVPVAAVAVEGVQLTVPAGVRIVTTADPVAERVGGYLAELIPGASRRSGGEPPAGSIALLLDAGYVGE